MSDWILEKSCNATGCGATGFEHWIRAFTGGNCLGDSRMMEKDTPCVSKCECSYAEGPWSRCCEGSQTRTLILKRESSSSGCNETKVEARSCSSNLGPCSSSGREPVSCLADSNEECSMACEWCDDHKPWRSILASAQNLLFFTPLRGGRVARALSGRGQSRIWREGEFRSEPGAKLSSNCRNITTVKQTLSRNRDPATKCHVQWSRHREYLVSGLCEGQIFFIDPCGVKFEL